MVVLIHVVVVMPIMARAEYVVMTAVHIDVLVVGVSYMGMRMTQGCQHQADTHNETEHAQKEGHRPECKRTSRRLAIPRADYGYYNDLLLLETAMLVYDALYTWRKTARDKPHPWSKQASA